MRDDPWTAANRDKERVPCAHSGRDAIVGPESAHTSAVVESLGPIPIGCAARSTGTLPDPGPLRRIWVASAVDRRRLNPITAEAFNGHFIVSITRSFMPGTVIIPSRFPCCCPHATSLRRP